MKKTYKSYDSGDGQPPIILIILVVGIICFIACYLIFGDKINQLQSENSKLQRQIKETHDKKEITEYIGSWTCVGEGVYQIEGYSKCNTSDGWSYIGDVRGHSSNGKGVLTTPEGDIRDGYFYNGNFIAGKISKSNGDAVKGLWTRNEDGTHLFEMGKTFKKSNGTIEMGDFQNGVLSYGMIYFIIEGSDNYTLGKFNNGEIVPNDGYFVTSNGCVKISNGNAKEITRTVTNTVYRNNGIKLSNPLGDFYKLGSKYNPYTVQLELK